MKRRTRSIERNRAVAGYLVALFLLLVVADGHLVVVKTTHALSDPTQSIMTVPEGIKPLYPPEVYGPDTLYEKINGQAELYLSAGFADLKSQWFAEAQNPDSMFEVYVYRMNDGLGAFSVYSVQRRGDARKLGFTQFAYHAGNSLYLVHGPYYVEMISATLSDTILPKMTALAQNFVQDTPVDMKSIELLGFFPEENLDPESISLVADNAFGFDGLDQVFTAEYNIDGRTVIAFISKRKTPQEAEDLAAGFHNHFMAFGGKNIKPEVAIKDAKMTEIFDSFDIMFSLNSYLAGVHQASTKTDAEKLAERLAEKLRSGPGEK